ncbi:MAG: hypothetical protein ABJX32_03935 [Tateyamaria sp.]|uniref:DUF7146 domain-containing protein n=1 Tax=Alphaproteobacteria TaxID=28211 RepID=UPI003299E191
MNARDLTLSLHGKWHGGYGSAPCPVCQAEGLRDQCALTLSDGDRLLAHCKKAGCDFSAILAAAGVSRGDYRPPNPALMAERKAEQQRESKRKAAQAMRCWEETEAANGTPAEAYLRGRAITCQIPATLRFHPGCWHGPTARRFPAMVARIDGGEYFAVQPSAAEGFLSDDLANGQGLLARFLTCRSTSKIGQRLRLTSDANADQAIDTFADLRCTTPQWLSCGQSRPLRTMTQTD